MEHCKSRVDAWWLSQADEHQVATEPTWCFGEAVKFYHRGLKVFGVCQPASCAVLTHPGHNRGDFFLLYLISLFSPLPFGMLKRQIGRQINCTFFISPRGVFIVSSLINLTLWKRLTCVCVCVPVWRIVFHRLIRTELLEPHFLPSIKAWFVGGKTNDLIDKALLLPFELKARQSPYHDLTC